MTNEFNPDWDTQAVLVEEIQRMAKRIEELEAKDEPAATLEDLEQEIYENTRQFVSLDVMEWMLKRYYTTPTQRTWVGLTDEELAELSASGLAWWDLWRAIEAKLKEKNT